MPQASVAATPADLDRAAERLEEQKSELIEQHRETMKVIDAGYEKQIEGAEAVLKRRGDLDNLIKLRAAMKQWRLTTEVPELRTKDEPALDRVFRNWRSTHRQKEDALRRSIQRLQQAYANHLKTTTRLLTIQEKLDLAQEADRRHKAALEAMEDPAFGRLPGEVRITAAFDKLKCLIWDVEEKHWYIHPLKVLEVEEKNGELHLGIGDAIKYGMAKIFFPLPLRARDVFTLEMKGSRSVDLLDTSHPDRCVFLRNRDKDVFHVFRTEIPRRRAVKVFRNDEAGELSTYERSVQGRKRSEQPFDVTGFYPGFSFSRGAPVVIRRFEIERKIR
ncbi:MAG: hypothetical protein AAF492_11835 [Verrucomicrobiota bacterium]